jgi:hypothetical protein
MQTECENETITKTSQTQDNAETASYQGIDPAVGEPDGLDPTRYGDWEKNGRCIDF